MANPREKKPVLHTKKHIARLERERRQTRLLLFSFIGVLVIIVGLVVYGYLDIKYFEALKPVAKVENVSIPVGEWQARVRMQRGQLISQLQLYQQYSQYFGMDLSSQEQQISSQLDSPTTLGQTVLDQMIDEQLIRDEAAKRGITASKAEVDQAIQAAYQFFPNGTPTPTLCPHRSASYSIPTDPGISDHHSHANGRVNGNPGTDLHTESAGVSYGLCHSGIDCYSWAYVDSFPNSHALHSTRLRNRISEWGCSINCLRSDRSTGPATL